MVNTETRLFTFFVVKDGEAVCSWEKKTRPGDDYGSVHQLLIAKFMLKLKNAGKTSRTAMYNLNPIPYEYAVKVTNRFKRLDLVNSVIEELWAEVHNTVQEAANKAIPKKKKSKKAKRLSQGALK